MKFFNKINKIKISRFLPIAIIISVFALALTFVINKFTELYFFDGTETSFKNKKFAEAYGTHCAFSLGVTGGSSFTDITSFNWNSEFQTTTINEGDTGVINLPFNFRYAGKTINNIGVGKSVSATSDTSISYNTDLYPAYNTSGTDEKLEFDTAVIGVDTVPYSVQYDVNVGPNAGDYYIRRKPEVKSKRFSDNGKSVFGIKIEYYTPENTPFEGNTTSAVGTSHSPTYIYPQDFIVDVNGDQVNATSTFSQPSNGTVTYQPLFNRYMYVPNGSFTGNDTFTFDAIANGDTISSSATVTITSVDANTDNYSATTGSHSIPVLNNDYYNASSYTLTITSGPVNNLNQPWGSATVNGTNIDFNVPSSGQGQLTYTLTDTVSGQTSTDILYVTSLGSGSTLTNNSPIGTTGTKSIANDDTVYIPIDGTTTINPLQNDSLYDSNLTIELISTNAGTDLSAFTVNPNNSLSIDTTQLANVNETLTYRLKSGTLESSPANITINGVGKVEYSQYIYLTDRDFKIVHYESADDVSVYRNGTINYKLETPSILSYTDVSLSQSFSSTINTINKVHLPNTGNIDSYGEFNQLNCNPYVNNDSFSVPNGGTSNLNVIGNIFTSPDYLGTGSNNGSDFDYEQLRNPSGLPLRSVQIITPPTNGTATVLPNNRIAYTPNSGYTGTDSLVYRLSDSSIFTNSDNSNQSSNATVSLTVFNGPAPEPDPESTHCGITGNAISSPVQTLVCLDISAGTATLYPADETDNNDICLTANDGNTIESITCSIDERTANLESKSVISSRQESNVTVHDLVLDDLRGLQSAFYAVDVTMCDLNGDTDNDNDYDDITYSLGYTDDGFQALFARYNPSTSSVISALKPASTVQSFTNTENSYWSKGSNTTVTNTTSPITVFYSNQSVTPGRYEIDNSIIGFELPAYMQTGKYRCNITYTLTL